jgi:hypothetical protein
MAKRKEIWERVESYLEFTGDLDEVIEMLKNKRDTSPAEYDKFEIRDEGGYEYTEFCLYGMRLETDEEFKKRTDKEKKEQERRKKARQKKLNKISADLSDSEKLGMVLQLKGEGNAKLAKIASRLSPEEKKELIKELEGK